MCRCVCACVWSLWLELRYGQAFWPLHAHNVHMAAKIYLQLCWDIIPFDRLRPTAIVLHSNSLSPSHSLSVSLSLSLSVLTSIAVSSKWRFFWLCLAFAFVYSCTRCNWAELPGRQLPQQTLCWIICAIYVALISLAKMYGNWEAKRHSLCNLRQQFYNLCCSKIAGIEESPQKGSIT